MLLGSIVKLQERRARKVAEVESSRLLRGRLPLNDLRQLS